MGAPVVARASSSSPGSTDGSPPVRSPLGVRPAGIRRISTRCDFSRTEDAARRSRDVAVRPTYLCATEPRAARGVAEPDQRSRPGTTWRGFSVAVRCRSRVASGRLVPSHSGRNGHTGTNCARRRVFPASRRSSSACSCGSIGSALARRRLRAGVLHHPRAIEFTRGLRPRVSNRRTSMAKRNDSPEARMRVKPWRRRHVTG